MEDGFSSADMIQNVSLLLTKLKGMFKHILRSLKLPHKGYRTLVRTELAMNYEIKPGFRYTPWISYSFFDDSIDDHRLLSNMHVSEHWVQTAATVDSGTSGISVI